MFHLNLGPKIDKKSLTNRFWEVLETCWNLLGVAFGRKMGALPITPPSARCSGRRSGRRFIGNLAAAWMRKEGQNGPKTHPKIDDLMAILLRSLQHLSCLACYLWKSCCQFSQLRKQLENCPLLSLKKIIIIKSFRGYLQTS